MLGAGSQESRRCSNWPLGQRLSLRLADHSSVTNAEPGLHLGPALQDPQLYQQGMLRLSEMGQ